MGYRKIKPRLIMLDGLADECGLFTSSTDLNSGYGCLSKSKQKSEQGKCYSFDCPLAREADLADLKEFDNDLYEEHKVEFAEKLKDGAAEEDCVPASQYGSDWMIQEMETR